MSIFDIFRKKEIITEELKPFENKGDDNISNKHLMLRTGEGVDDLSHLGDVVGWGKQSLSSFNQFYNRYVNVDFTNERQRILYYRQMAETPEISDVVEDAIIESTHDDINGDILTLNILDNEIAKDNNICKNLNDEFNDFFYNKIDIKRNIWNLVRTYFIDGRYFYERIIHKNKSGNGIIGIKLLPTETMDFLYEPMTGQVIAYFQYLTEEGRRYTNVEDARKDEKVIVFFPEQIGYVNYGIYGRTRKEIIGYLEKSKQPYNQLKLLETSVIIYRIVRSPERLVFKIDTGNMPRDKAMKFVEKIKRSFTKKVSYDSKTGNLTQSPEVMSILENYFIPTSPDGRGSSIEAVGGNSTGFTSLDDIYYFQKKLYRALKYPMSRVTAQQDHRENEVVFGGTNFGEIQRDELKWAKFLERHQFKFCDDFLELFLLHLEFKGLKKEYDLDKSKINIRMTPPNNYKEQMDQQKLRTDLENYNAVISDPNMSKSFCMRKYLGWDDDVFELNKKGFDDDKKYFHKPEPEESPY